MGISGPAFGEETRQLLLRSLPCAAMVTDRDLRILSVNPEWEALYLTPGEAVTGLTLYQIHPPSKQYHAAFAKCLATGEVLTAALYRAALRDGSSRVLRSVTLPWKDKRGDAGGLIFLSSEAPGSSAGTYGQRTEERLSKATELAGIYVWELDLATGAAWATGAEDTFFEGAVGAKELRDDMWSTVHPEDRAATRAVWEKSLAEGRPYRAEYRLNRPDRLVWVSASTAVMAGAPAQPERLLGVIQNITERKQAELAADAGNHAKSAFLATVSHEIRTPLNGILGMAQAMDREALSDTQRERLGVIRQSGEALLAILNDVLDLSKIEAGKLDLEDIEFDFSDIADGVCSAFSTLAEGKGLSFETDVEEARGVYRGDPTRVRQVLYNLVSNALKFTDGGQIKVSASAEARELRITVADTGIGIPQEKLRGLFAPFSQADASTTRRYGGSGLGLSICRQLVELMGGRIEVDTEERRGSAFTVTLPLSRIRDEAADKDAASQDAAPSQIESVRVLAAEDNAVNQLVLRTLLEQVGVEPHIVANGALAVAAWAREPWDIVLMDIQMPEMDGLAATQLIRERESMERRPRTPIIALTANAMAHQIAEYIEAGMDDHVPKPIEAAQLFRAIERLLARPAKEEAA